MVVASAPGKCILFGEHAVVYGQPAVAVAIDARVELTIELAESGWSIDGMSFDKTRHPHMDSVRKRLWSNDGGPALDLQVSSDLFGAAGLGSSAAICSAFAAGLLHCRGTDSGALPYSGIATTAHLAEADAQGGRASPTDTSTVTLGGAIYVSNQKESIADWQFSRDLRIDGELRSWEIHCIDLPESLSEASLVIGFTGRPGPTGEMVAKVADLLKNEPERMTDIERIGHVTRAGVTALNLGNLEAIGIAMNECHRLLQGLGVSDPDLDRMVDAALPSSLGAKMTGAGGGGCMIALTLEPRRTAEAIELAGGRTLVSSLGAPGVRIEKSADVPIWNS
ncbi:MAG: mevalonate kinase [Candidatus Thalassarchaeaceae archaeon]|jgi:mevalonate kinase|nr:mevalonate kinase [Candidatus Thalassarchaeaceae archaeon]